MDLNDQPGGDEPEPRPNTPPDPKPDPKPNPAPAPSPEPDPVMATFRAWLDHILACGDCYGGGRPTARHCYHSALLGDRHHEAARAARADRAAQATRAARQPPRR
ncbi:hypothetical protein ACWD4G_42390 [Streptomyces sp. NPDC002643]